MSTNLFIVLECGTFSLSSCERQLEDDLNEHERIKKNKRISSDEQI